MPYCSAARKINPGDGFLQSHRSRSSWWHVKKSSIGSSERIASWISRIVSSFCVPRATSGWCYDNQPESQGLQYWKARLSIRVDDQFRDTRWRKWSAVSNHSLIDHPVSIQKYSPGPFDHRTDSHLVAERFRSGWDTNRCQITA